MQWINKQTHRQTHWHPPIALEKDPIEFDQSSSCEGHTSEETTGTNNNLKIHTHTPTQYLGSLNFACLNILCKNKGGKTKGIEYKNTKSDKLSAQKRPQKLQYSFFILVLIPQFYKTGLKWRDYKNQNIKIFLHSFLSYIIRLYYTT